MPLSVAAYQMRSALTESSAKQFTPTNGNAEPLTPEAFVQCAPLSIERMVVEHATDRDIRHRKGRLPTGIIVQPGIDQLPGIIVQTLQRSIRLLGVIRIAGARWILDRLHPITAIEQRGCTSGHDLPHA